MDVVLKLKEKTEKTHIYIYTFKISIGYHELEDFKSKVDDRFSYHNERTVTNAIVNRKYWVEIGEKFGHLAHNKFIPNFILNLPKERLKIFLNGYMDGDGCILKKSPHMKRNTTVSEKLALTLLLAVQKCYYGGSISYSKRNSKHIIEDRLVNQRDTYSVSFSKDNLKNSNFNIFDDFVSYNITKNKKINSRITKTNLIEKVYNIEVEEDNSYIVNNLVVHNCQGFSFSGKQLNFEDERSKLFFEYVRLLNECKPKYFLLENVNMKKEYRDVISCLLGVEPIVINSHLVSAQNRKRLYWTNIPNVSQPDDKNISMYDILDKEVDTRSLVSERQMTRLDVGNLTRAGQICFRVPGKENKRATCLMARDAFGIGGLQGFNICCVAVKGKYDENNNLIQTCVLKSDEEMILQKDEFIIKDSPG